MSQLVLVLLHVILPLQYRERSGSSLSLVELPDAVGLNHSTSTLNMQTGIFAFLGHKSGRSSVEDCLKA